MIFFICRHPNIVRVIEVCTTKEIYCLCLEYIQGMDLLEALRNVGKFPEARVKEISGQVIGAIAYLHTRKILHRDLKLENVMLSEDRALLIDFGLSNFWQGGQEMKTHCGSADYAAPELIRGDVHYGPPIDIWSFGGIVHTSLITFTFY